MKQSKLMSFAESAINIGVGFGISLGAQMVFLPMIGVPINHTQNFIFALIMTVISLARSFGLRRLFEALHIRTPLSPFMLAVAAERRRQVEGEHWSAEHDDFVHQRGDLAHAGGCYAMYAKSKPGGAVPDEWGWDHEWWKPTDFRRNLIKAAALIAAEGDKFDRAKTKRSAS